MTTSGNTSHPSLSHTDSIAASWSDFLLLVGRVFLGWLFLASGYGKFGSIAGTSAYFTSLGMSAPELWAWFAAFTEVILGAGLILGLATRYVALASFLWVVVATAIAHRYWTYPAEAQAGQYINWLKNIAIMGGTLYAFVIGAGRYSLDTMLAKR
jgi:putative oxidoreductase